MFISIRSYVILSGVTVDLLSTLALLCQLLYIVHTKVQEIVSLVEVTQCSFF
jgi:uncharacterized protein with PQ loop repeat